MIKNNFKINKRRGGRSKKKPRECSDVCEVDTVDGGDYFEITTLRCLPAITLYLLVKKSTVSEWKRNKSIV